MEKHKLVIDSANIHTSRSRMTSARKHACMRNWKTTNPSSGLDRTTNIIHSAKIHTCAHASTQSLTYDKWTKKIENTRKSIIRARWNNTNLLLLQQTYTHLLVQVYDRSRITSARRHACMKNWKTTNPSSGLDRTANSIHSAKKYTCARASTHSLTYDKCTKEIENTHKSIIRAKWDNTNLLLIHQTYTHLLVQAHAPSRMTSARSHACMNNRKYTQIHHQG